MFKTRQTQFRCQTLSPFSAHLLLPFISNKKKKKSRSGGHSYSSDGLVNLKAGRDELVASLLQMLYCVQRLNRRTCKGYLQVIGHGWEWDSYVQEVLMSYMQSGSS